DLDLHDVAIRERHRWGAEGTYTQRGSGGDDVPGEQGKARGEIGDDLGDGEDHFPGVGVLHRHAVDTASDGKGLRIWDVSRRDDDRPDRTERVQALGTDPLLLTSLDVAGRDVV